jgi:RNA-directed DNA polymerase
VEQLPTLTFNFEIFTEPDYGSNTKSKLNVIRYADDYIITGKYRELLEEKVIPVVIDFLAERGH